MAHTSDTAPALTLYNSLTRQKKEFKPKDPNRVTLYNCGPTVYSYAHIGNARAAVVADVLFRVLLHIYDPEQLAALTAGEDYPADKAKVVYARNITDVDDKIIAAAKEKGVEISKITEKFARIYKEDLAAIGCLPPTHQPKATEHIQEMADIIITLLDREIAYEAEDHILFSPKEMNAYAKSHGLDRRYGELSKRALDDNLAGARVEVATYKRDPSDFVLWKPAKAEEPGWSQQETSKTYKVNWRNYANRPFANIKGRPGWHIECSAMAKAKLGETIDIHCGGVDLKFPHHENEIAQSESANDKKFARFWVHNEFLNMGKDKMSKSLGNVTLVRDLLKEWDGEVIRLALLKAHYRSELNWSEDLLKESKEQLHGWYRQKELYVGLKSLGDGFKVKTLIDEMFDDLNTVLLLADLDNVSDFIKQQYSQKISDIQLSENEDWNRFVDLDFMIKRANFLGLLQKDPEEWFKGGLDYDALVAEYDDVRAQALAAKAAGDKALMGQMFARSDELREQFKTEGVVVESGKDGKSTWRKA